VVTASNLTRNSVGVTSIANDTFVHVAGVFVSASKRDVFLNGVLDGTDDQTRAVNAFTRVTVGAAFNGGTVGNLWSGQVADAVIYNRDLSAAEVLQLKVGGPKSVLDGLVFWVRGTEPGDLRDIVGGRTLTAYNSPTVSSLHPRTR
jgi:hypothetical protein